MLKRTDGTPHARAHGTQERIVEANVGLIKMMARRHHPATMAKGNITSDVIQEGSLALLRAAETYNPQLGYRFSTYAGWWVRDRVTRCVTQQARIIRLPQYGEDLFLLFAFA